MANRRHLELMQPQKGTKPHAPDGLPDFGHMVDNHLQNKSLPKGMAIISAAMFLGGIGLLGYFSILSSPTGVKINFGELQGEAWGAVGALCLLGMIGLYISHRCRPQAESIYDQTAKGTRVEIKLPTQ